MPEYPVFYTDTLGLGGNSQHWGKDVVGLGAVPPAGSRGRAGSFLLHK